MSLITDFRTIVVPGSPPAVQVLGAGDTALLLNIDPAGTTIDLGSNTGILPSDLSGIAPLSSGAVLAFDGTTDSSGNIYAISDTPGVSALLAVYPGAVSAAPGPQLIAEALIGIAGAIAQAIAAQGINIVGAPILLYNTSIQGTATGTAPTFGVSIGDGVPAEYGCPNPGSITSYDCANTAFDALIAPFATSATKLFGTTSITSPSKWHSAIDQGHALYCCYTPSTSNLASDLTAIENDLATIKAACTAAANGSFIAGVIFYQEPIGKVTAAQFQSVYNFYGPPIRALGYKLYTCFQHGSPAVHSMNTYPLTSGGAAAITVDGNLGDFYATSWANNGTLLDSGDNGGAPVGGVHNNLAAISAAMGVPWGLAEIGKESNNQTPPPLTGPNSLQGYLNYIQGVVTGILANNGTFITVIWFDGRSGEPNVLLTGDPLLPFLKTFIGGITTLPSVGIAAGATQNFSALRPSANAKFASAVGLSYDVTLNLIASGGSTRPFATVTFTWFNTDSVSATPVATQSWTLPAGTGTGTIITGVGPMHGQFLQVSIFNDDTVQMNASIQVNSTGRTVARHDWLWDVASSVAVPTFTLAAGSGPFSNDIGEVNNVPVPANSSVTRLNGMRSGEAYVRTNSAGGKVQFELIPVPNNVFGGSDSINVTPNAEITQILDLPRGPMLWTFTNSDTVSHNVSARITSKDG